MKDFVFGVLALDPQRGCDGACTKAAYPDSIRRWAHAIRRHTNAASTDVAIFTGEGRGSIANLGPQSVQLASTLQDARVRILRSMT